MPLLKQLSNIIIIAIFVSPLASATPLHMEQRDPSSFNFTRFFKLQPADPIPSPAPDNIQRVDDDNKFVQPDSEPGGGKDELTTLEPPDLDFKNDKANLDQSQPEDPDLDDKNDKLTQLQPPELDLDDERIKLAQLQTPDDSETKAPVDTLEMDDKKNNSDTNLENRDNIISNNDVVLENRAFTTTSPQNNSNGSNITINEWWKEDSTTEDYDYDSTPKEPTPDAHPIKRTGINYLQPCQFYGSQFRKVQMGSASVIKPEKASQYSKHICKLSQRLECIPSKVQKYVDVSSSSKTKQENHDYAGQVVGGGQTDVIEITTESVNKTLRPPKDLKGFCRCIRGMGDRPRFMKAKKEDTFKTGCYIPAGFAQASSCAHEISVPYGTMDGGGTNVRKVLGKTKDLCVPNAECRTGYTYIGLRCQCVKKATWQPKTGECHIPDDGTGIRAFGIQTTAIIAFFAMVVLW